MPYRDQREADQARIGLLEEQNKNLWDENKNLREKNKELRNMPVTIKHIHPPKPPGNGIPIDCTNNHKRLNLPAFTLIIVGIYTALVVLTFVLTSPGTITFTSQGF